MTIGIKTSTFETYESIYRLYIKNSSIGIKKIKDIKSIMIQTFLNNLHSKVRNYLLLAKIYKLLKRFFNYQIEIYALLKNPCVSLKVPGQIYYLKEKISAKIEIFTSEEQDRILNYPYGTHS
ncbi:hypothetical protein [Clostridium sp. UBA5119]|uniref:hypothetical protein n=1 Tax=Clostridium sp. UBA5119 TaxID=1946366 RepID=UPI003217EE62